MASIGIKTQSLEGPWFELDFCESRIIFSEVDSPVSISVWVNNEKRYIVDQCHKMKITQKKRGCYLLRLAVAAHVILCFRKRHYTKT